MTDFFGCDGILVMFFLGFPESPFETLFVVFCWFDNKPYICILYILIYVCVCVGFFKEDW